MNRTTMESEMDPQDELIVRDSVKRLVLDCRFMNNLAEMLKGDYFDPYLFFQGGPTEDEEFHDDEIKNNDTLLSVFKRAGPELSDLTLDEAQYVAEHAALSQIILDYKD